MKAPSIDIKDILEAESHFEFTFGTDLFVGSEPKSPDNCVTIFDTPGYSPQLTMDRTERYDYPAVQIRVRNRDYEAGWAVIEDIKTELHGRAGETWNAAVYTLIKVLGEPFMLDRDENNRVRFVMNLDIQRR